MTNKLEITFTPILVFGLVFFIATPAFADGAMQLQELTLLKAIILGLVEGLTEYLPISSTGHLLVTNKILGIGTTPETEAAIETYAIAIQIGAIAAVLVLYKSRITQMLNGLTGNDVEGTKILLAVLTAFTPTAIIGLVLKPVVEDNLFGPFPIAIAWILGGLGILLFVKYKQTNIGLDLGQITTKQAAMIGIAQAIALWPGTSRSLVTILAAVLLGLSMKAAVEFSFLLGLITLSAATGLSVLQDGSELVNQFGYLNPIIGLIVAFFAALISIKFMVNWLEKRGFKLFGYYRIVIGVLALVAISFDKL